MQTFESKLLAALETAVDDGDIVESGGYAVFAYHGELPFLRSLFSSLKIEQKSLLFYEWLAAGDDDVADAFLDALTTVMPNVSGLQNVLADKILKHYETEVDQMLREKNNTTPGPIEGYKAARDAA